jgi:hypothetical protein
MDEKMKERRLAAAKAAGIPTWQEFVMKCRTERAQRLQQQREQQAQKAKEALNQQ